MIVYIDLYGNEFKETLLSFHLIIFIDRCYHLMITFDYITMNKYTKKDLSLETLLDLNGEIFLLENGYWTKFDVFEVAPTPQIPHGIKYSLTLHDRNNTRVLGFDNAHALKPKKKKYGAQKITWDHKHKTGKVYAYEFESASQLIEDFWKAVEEILK